MTSLELLLVFLRALGFRVYGVSGFRFRFRLHRILDLGDFLLHQSYTMLHFPKRVREVVNTPSKTLTLAPECTAKI